LNSREKERVEPVQNKIVLTIAGSDPTGGAGIQADLKTFHALGLYGLSVISAITAQDSKGVRGVFHVAPKAFSLQLETVLSDFRIDAVKTGMLVSADHVRITVDFLKRFPPRILVIDPVIRSSNGVPLLNEEGVSVMMDALFPLATAVTPNLSEAGILSGMDRSPDEEEDSWIRRMCKSIQALGPRDVIVTGGHRSGDPMDLLYDGIDFVSFPGPRAAKELHGSGCIFSSALCGYLALGCSMNEAVSRSKQYTLERFLEK